MYFFDYNLMHTEIGNTQECFPSGETFCETFIHIFSIKGSVKLDVYPYQLQELQKSNGSLLVNKAERHHNTSKMTVMEQAKGTSLPQNLG